MRTLGSLFLWHIECTILSAMYPAVVGALALFMSSTEACAKDIAASVTLAGSAVVALVLQAVVACAPRRDYVTHTAHHYLAHALVATNFIVTVSHSLHLAVGGGDVTICTAVSVPFLFFCLGISCIVAFTATESGHNVPLMFTHECLTVTSIVVFGLSQKPVDWTSLFFLRPLVGLFEVMTGASVDAWSPDTQSIGLIAFLLAPAATALIVCVGLIDLVYHPASALGKGTLVIVYVVLLGVSGFYGLLFMLGTLNKAVPTTAGFLSVALIAMCCLSHVFSIIASLAARAKPEAKTQANTQGTTQGTTQETTQPKKAQDSSDRIRPLIIHPSQPEVEPGADSDAETMQKTKMQNLVFPGMLFGGMASKKSR